jgi:hypothetical protein
LLIIAKDSAMMRGPVGLTVICLSMCEHALPVKRH